MHLLQYIPKKNEYMLYLAHVIYIDLASSLKKVDQKWQSFADVLEGENKVRNGDKLHITRDGWTTFVILALKG